MFTPLTLILAALQPAPVPAPAAQSISPAAVLMTFDARGGETVRMLRGQADRSSGRALSPDDPVRIASISKLVVALGVMRLVEAGRLDLDADVSRYLGWELRSPHHPTRPITLAHLLGHRAGLTDRIDYIMPLDGDLPAALHNAAGWDADRAPGGAFAYANINFPVIAAAMEGATGERFDLLMRRIVLDPLTIDGCYNWASCSAATRARAVSLYRPNGDVARDDAASIGDCPVVPARDGSCDLGRYPLARHGAAFSPQGGLRISARGLASIGRMWLNGGRTAQGTRFLTRRSLTRLATIQPVTPTGSVGGEGGEGSFFCGYGLAVHRLAHRRAGCRDDPIGDGVARIGHSGDAYSLRSGLWLDPRRHTGIVWFVTQVPEVAPRGARSEFSAAEEALIDAAGLGPVAR